MRLPVMERNGEQILDMEELKAMVDLFLERGFTYFDVAYTYHNGKCEEAMRRALVERHLRERFLLADKLPTMLIQSEEHQERLFFEQLRRCGVDYFDRYLIHCATKAFYKRAQLYHSFEFAARIKREGYARKIGFSFHDSPELLEEILTRYPEIDFVQLQISYMDWELTPIQARRCYETALRHGKPVVAMCPLKGGMLAAPPRRAEQLLRRARPDAEPASWALRYAAGFDGVETVLSGMSSLRQMKENIAFMEHFEGLDEQEYETLEKVAALTARLTPVQCTRCGYCIPTCPQVIPIPDDLWLLNDDVAADHADSDRRRKAYFQTARGHGLASECIECYNCEAACPQHLRIVDWLRQVASRFEELPQTV